MAPTAPVAVAAEETLPAVPAAASHNLSFFSVPAVMTQLTFTDDFETDKGWTVGPIPVGTYTLKIGEGEHKVEREVHITAGAIEAVHVQFQ